MERERDDRPGDGADDHTGAPWGEMGRGVPAGLGSGDLGEEADIGEEAVAGGDDEEEGADSPRDDG
jgi:hypothetical protein